MKTLYTHISKLYGCYAESPKFKKGKDMMLFPYISDSFLLEENGKITDFGPIGQSPTNADRIIDLKQRIVLPTWIDSHTHIVYADSRENEYLMRIEGATYQQIAESGGGILNSAQKLRNASEQELFENAEMRLLEMINLGTGTIEVKSGYGLSFESEVKMLRVIRKLKEKYSITIKSTFLGAHAIPNEYRTDRNGYIKEITEKMIPYISDHGLADYIDVFCDEGYFTTEETARIIEKGYKYGMKAKIHANELANSGGVQVGVKHKAISVDHLEQIGENEIAILQTSNTIPTVLPSVSFFLGIRYAPSRLMIDSGLGIAIASDYNPGSSPSGNMPFLLSLACNKMKLHPHEAFNAITVNASHALEIGDKVGSICKGHDANFIVTKDISSIYHIPYSFGSNPVEEVYIKGIKYK